MAKVTLNSIDTIIKNLDLEEGGKVQKFFANTCKNHMDKYVPFDTGTLSGTVEVKPTSILYDQPYAEYVYVGISPKGVPLNYQTDKHPLAGSHWDKKMMTAEASWVLKEVQDYADKRGVK